MTNQSDTQQSLRTSTGKAYDYNGDWAAQFDLDGIATGTWNGRLLLWINAKLGTSDTVLPQAQQAYAVNQGYYNWSSMGAITLGGATPANAYVAEDGATFYVAEDGATYYVQEV